MEIDAQVRFAPGSIVKPIKSLFEWLPKVADQRFHEHGPTLSDLFHEAQESPFLTVVGDFVGSTDSTLWLTCRDAQGYEFAWPSEYFVGISVIDLLGGIT